MADLERARRQHMRLMTLAVLDAQRNHRCTRFATDINWQCSCGSYFGYEHEARQHTADEVVYAVEAVLRTEVNADLDLVNAHIAQGPEVHDWDQIDQWACERVALNRVLALLGEEPKP